LNNPSSFSLRPCKKRTKLCSFRFDLSKFRNKLVTFASIEKMPYYRSFASLRFDIVAIARYRLWPQIFNEYLAQSEGGGDVATFSLSNFSPLIPYSGVDTDFLDCSNVKLSHLLTEWGKNIWVDKQRISTLMLYFKTSARYSSKEHLKVRRLFSQCMLTVSCACPLSMEFLYSF